MPREIINGGEHWVPRAERDALAADNAALRVEIAKWRAERDTLAAQLAAEKELWEANTIAYGNALNRVQELELALYQYWNAETPAAMRAADAATAKLLRQYSPAVDAALAATAPPADMQ